MNTNLLLSAAIIVVAVFFGVMGKRWERDDIGFNIIVLLVLLLPSIWVPQLVRDVVLSLVVGAIMSFAGGSGIGKLAWATVCGGILFAVSRAVPGGATVVVSGIMLIVLGFIWHEAWTHRKRISRAEALDPSEKPKYEVEIGGTVRRLAPVELPDGYDAPNAAGWRRLGDRERYGPALLTLDTSAGPVLIDMGTVTLEDASHALPNRDAPNARVDAGGGTDLTSAEDANGVKRDFLTVLQKRTQALSEDDTKDGVNADRGKDANGADSAGDASEDSESPDVLLIVDEGKDAYVIGTPTWTRAAGGMSGYRDAPVVPVFGEGATLYLVSEAEIDARTKWHLALSAGFAAACALVATAQVVQRYL